MCWDAVLNVNACSFKLKQTKAKPNMQTDGHSLKVSSRMEQDVSVDFFFQTSTKL